MRQAVLAGGSQLAVIISLFLPMEGTAAEPRAREVRAIWVTRWDFRTESDVRSLVRNCASLGLNRIYFQARGRGDALYRSRYEPWAEEIGGRDPGFDPLEVATREARARGVELHAWLNVLAGWKGKKPPRSREHVFHRHPEWFMKDRYGKRHLLDSHYTILNPCLPEVRRHLLNVTRDIASRYAIDGLHLDYIRFIAESQKDRQAVPYDNQTLAQFRKLTGGFPVRHPARWDQFRRDAVSRVVRDMAQTARSVRPGCKISAAVVRDLERGKQRYFQDGALWRRSGWIDELVPMNYERSVEKFRGHLSSHLAATTRQTLIGGVGVYLIDNPETLTRQIDSLRRSGARGYSLFGYANFFGSPSHESARNAAAIRKRRNFCMELKSINRI